MRLVLDLEADSLDPTRIWCIVVKDLDSSYEDVCVPNGWSNQGMEWDHYTRQWLENVFNEDIEEVIGHNIIEFDLPVLRQLTGFNLPESCAVRDTLVLSRLANPDLEGGHSLRAWGERLGFPKGDHSDWSVYSDEMLRYCRRDVDVTEKLYRWAEEQGIAADAMKLEHRIAHIIKEQQDNGFYFDDDRARELVDLLTDLIRDIDDRIGFPTHKGIKAGTTVSVPFKMDGNPKKAVVDYLHEYVDRFGIDCIAGPFTKLTVEEFNPDSVQQLKDWLLENGWEPDTYTPKGAPQLSNSSLEAFGERGVLLVKRGVYKHRLGQVQGFLERLRPDGRIGGGANPCGTPTGRMRHRHIVNIPKVSKYPKDHEKEGHLLWFDNLEGLDQKIPFGTEIRSLFTVPEDRVLVGYDAKGLELRILAHYINDPEYTEVVINGDPHSHHEQIGQLPDRDAAKKFIYAFIYGAFYPKLGAIVGGGFAEGKALAERFYTHIPGLRGLVSGVEQAAKRGYLVGLDGRHLILREERKALNTLIQGGGAVCMKKIAEILDRKIDKTKCMKVVDMHDEAQIECDPAYVDTLTELIHESFVECTQHFNLRCPLEADVKVGRNWAETH